MQEYLIASSHSSAIASAEHTEKGLLHLVFFHDNSRARGPLLWSIATKHSVLCYWWFWRPFRKKIETALLKTRNMRPNYRGRVNWNMYSVVVQCLYLPTSMLLLTLAMMGGPWATCGFPNTTPKVGTKKFPLKLSVSLPTTIVHMLAKHKVWSHAGSTVNDARGISCSADFDQQKGFRGMQPRAQFLSYTYLSYMT